MLQLAQFLGVVKRDSHSLKVGRRILGPPLSSHEGLEAQASQTIVCTAMPDYAFAKNGMYAAILRVRCLHNAKDLHFRLQACT